MTAILSGVVLTLIGGYALTFLFGIYGFGVAFLIIVILFPVLYKLGKIEDRCVHIETMLQELGAQQISAAGGGTPEMKIWRSFLTGYGEALDIIFGRLSLLTEWDGVPILEEVDGQSYYILSSDGPYSSMTQLKEKLQSCFTENFLCQVIFVKVNLFDGPDAVYRETEDGRLLFCRLETYPFLSDCAVVPTRLRLSDGRLTVVFRQEKELQMCQYEYILCGTSGADWKLDAVQCNIMADF